MPMARFRVLTCADCTNESRVMVVRQGAGEAFSRCLHCGGDDWLNLPEIPLHEDDVPLLNRVLERERMERERLLRRLRDTGLERDPDSPEAQDWYYDEDGA